MGVGLLIDESMVEIVDEDVVLVKVLFLMIVCLYVFNGHIGMLVRLMIVIVILVIAKI